MKKLLITAARVVGNKVAVVKRRLRIRLIQRETSRIYQQGINRLNVPDPVVEERDEHEIYFV